MRLPDLIIMEGDTNIAQMFCGCCQQSFRANIELVTCVDTRPICKDCIQTYNPKRIELGLEPMPFHPQAYL